MKTLLLSAALAHVTQETQYVVAGSGDKAVLRVPHGCDGSPTTSIRVLLPEGFRLAKPKAGWPLATPSSKLWSLSTTTAPPCVTT